MSRKKRLSTFIDEMTYRSRYKEHKVGDVVVYKKLSDGSISMGEIKWFNHSKKSDVMCVTLIDHIVNNFQSCTYEDIDQEPSASTLKKLKDKIAKYRRKSS